MKKRTTIKLALFVCILALAGMACGASDLGSLLATATPTFTATFTPTATYTPTPTATSTPTPTPTTTPLPGGVVSQEQADGSTLFIDYDNLFQLTLPENWIVIPIDQDGLAEVLDNLSEKNPDLAEAAQAFRKLDPDVFRMAALFADPDRSAASYGTNITVTVFEDSLMSSMPLSFVTGALEQSFIDAGGRVLTEGVNPIENDNGVEVEYIDIEQTSAGVKVAQRVIVFQVDGGLVLITITVPVPFKAQILPVSDEIGGSIEMLK